MLRITTAVLLAGAIPGAPADMKPEPVVIGVVKAVDAAKGTITVSVGKEQEKTYDLAKDAKVVLDGPAKLADLAPGTRVALEFAADTKTIIEVRAEPFTVTVKPTKNQVAVNEPFDAELRVVNASPSPQSFRVMNCGWDEHWRSSNARVSWVGWDCPKNFPVTVKLAPGEAYAKTLSMLGTAAGPVSFQMGFTPLESTRTHWSNEVTLEVTRGPDKK